MVRVVARNILVLMAEELNKVGTRDYLLEPPAQTDWGAIEEYSSHIRRAQLLHLVKSCFRTLGLGLVLGQTCNETINLCLWRESNLLASMRPITASCVHVPCIVCVRDCVMVKRKPCVQIMHDRHTHKAVTGALKPKGYSCVEGNRTIASVSCIPQWPLNQNNLRCKLQLLVPLLPL